MAYCWGDKLRKIPNNFVIGDWTLRQAFDLWFDGNKEKKWPPLRELGVDDVFVKKAPGRKRYSEYSRFMMLIEGFLQDHHQLVLNPSATELSTMFKFLSDGDFLLLGAATDKGRKRRCSELKYTSYIRAMYEK